MILIISIWQNVNKMLSAYFSKNKIWQQYFCIFIHN